MMRGSAEEEEEEEEGCVDAEGADAEGAENPHRHTVLPISWRSASALVVASGLVQREKCTIVCVCGGGNTGGNGKNVYARFLVNSILFSSGEVAVIDGDCVHPEFATPGMVSLAVLRKPLAAPGAVHFTPDTLRQKAVAPLKSFFVGSSPKVLAACAFLRSSVF